jgi:hypothetical protein
MATRQSRDDGYGRSTRFYRIDDERSYPSVTSILQAAPAKPALIGWAAKEERLAVIDAACKLWDDVPLDPKMSADAYRATLENRVGKEKAYRKQMQKAADIGTQAHALIEWQLRGELLQERGDEPATTDKARWAVMAWEDWRKEVNLSPLMIEQTVWSNEHRYAGTLDLVCELDCPEVGRVHAVTDWKSGKGIYAESKLQNVAYLRALEEMGHHAPSGEYWGLIVRIPKDEKQTKCEMLWISPADQKRHWKAFLNAFGVWKWQEQENGNA